MSSNKNALIRCQALNNCFRNPGKKYFIDDLVNACNEALSDFYGELTTIEKRSVYGDIKLMIDSKGYNAPIETFKEGRKVYYRYTDQNFSINNQPLNEEEALKIKEALITLSHFKGMPQFEWVNEMITRLESSFKLDSNSKQVIEFEQNLGAQGLEYISQLYNAIVYEEVLKLTTESFKSEKVEVFEIHPYFLKQYNNRWFLFGLNATDSTIQKKALDRIITIESTNSEYIKTDIDFSDYFFDVIGVTVNNKSAPGIVKLRVDSTLWPYIKTKPLHDTQSSKVDESTLGNGYVDVTLKVIPNYELESKILEHGEKIEVIVPIELREKITFRIKKSLIKYKSAD